MIAREAPATMAVVHSPYDLLWSLMYCTVQYIIKGLITTQWSPHNSGWCRKSHKVLLIQGFKPADS